MGAMNKRELAKAVAVQADVELKTVITVIDGFTDVVTAVVSKGEPVSIPGFAKFVKVNRAARMGRNPATAPKLVKGAYPTSDAAVAAAGKSAAPAAAKKAPARAAAKKAPARKAATARKAPARKAPARKAPAKRAPAKRAAKR
jgi:DNA-binding protein HU-beta